MARDHYIPAAFLGRFSTDRVTRPRDRTVYVCRKGRTVATSSRASNLGYVNNLYGSSSSSSSSLNVDHSVAGYERRLPAALDKLELTHHVNLDTWLRVLVPFVASMFVRGHDFSQRFEDRPVVRMALENALVDDDNTNRARIMEMQRLLAPVMCARWVVMHYTGAGTFITNDLGLMGTRDVPRDANGWAIPIGLRAVLGIFPRKQSIVAYYQNGSWVPVIEHRNVVGQQFHGANRGMANFATQWIAGCEPSVVQGYSDQLQGGPQSPSLVMETWPFTHRVLVAHDLEWHRLVSATAGDVRPDMVTDLQSVNWSLLSRAYLPSPVLTINQTIEMPTGLSRRGGNIQLSLHELENYERYFHSL